MKKYIRRFLPWAELVVIIILFFTGNAEIALFIMSSIFYIGITVLIVLLVKRHKLRKKIRELKMKIEEAVVPELDEVKGNSLKKEMVRRKLIREHLENDTDYKNYNTRLDDIRNWTKTVTWCLGGGVLVILVHIPLLLFIILAFSGGDHATCPIGYPDAEDLQKVTGVEFPDVVPVDSFYSENGLGSYVAAVKFTSVKPLNKEFFNRLDNACKTDSCCWKKEAGGYRYFIYPDSIPFDRTKGQHRRMVDDSNGNQVPDWDGYYFSVSVSTKGDSITLCQGSTL